MDYFEIIRMILLVIIMSAEVVDDCRRYRISNRIIICGFIAAAGVFLTEQIMKGGAMQYLTACIAGLGVMSAIYIVKGAGAGDVKLSAVCGMLLGIKGVLIMIISSLICAAVVGTAGIVMGRCSAIQIGNMKMHRIHYSIYMAAGCVIAVLTNIYIGG